MDNSDPSTNIYQLIESNLGYINHVYLGNMIRIFSPITSQHQTSDLDTIHHENRRVLTAKSNYQITREAKLR